MGGLRVANMPIPSPQVITRGEWALAGRLLQRSQVRVLRPRESRDAICGFAVIDLDLEPTAVHFAYVARGLRRHGWFKRLLADVLHRPWVYTRETPMGQKVARRCGGQFDPYALFSTAEIAQ